MVSQEDKSTDCHQMILMDFCRKDILKTYRGISRMQEYPTDLIAGLTGRAQSLRRRKRSSQRSRSVSESNWNTSSQTSGDHTTQSWDQKYFIMRTNWNITIQILLSLWSARGRSQIYALPSRTGKQFGWWRTYIYASAPTKYSTYLKYSREVRT